VDLFTLECVVFEVVTGDTLFKSDWVLTKFVEKEEDILEDYWPTASPNSRLFLLGQFTFLGPRISTKNNFYPGMTPQHQQSDESSRNASSRPHTVCAT